MSTAFDKLGASKSLSMTFKLDATPAQLLAATGLDSSPDNKMTAAESKQFSGLGASITLSSDKPIKDVLDSAQATADGALDPGLNLAFEVHAGDAKPLIEVRTVAGKEYLRTDLDAIAKLGGDSSTASEIAGIHDMFNGMPASFAPLKALADGKWISMDPKSFADLAKSFGGSAAATPSAAPTLAPATKNKLVAALTDVFTQDVTLTDKGTADGVDHLVLEAPARKLVADVQKAVAPIAKDIPSIGSSFPTAAPTGIADGKASADIYLNADGAVSKLAIDLGQLDSTTAGKAQIPVSLTFDDKAAPTTAPAGAVAFDPKVLKDLFKNLGGLDPSTA